MKATYNPDQVGFDFGDSGLIRDVGAVIDIDGFPEISIEDVFETLRNARVDHVWTVYRLAKEIWEDVLDAAIVEELRESRDFPPTSLHRIAQALGCDDSDIENEFECALSALKDSLNRLEEAA